MPMVDDLFASYAKSFEAHREAEMSLAEYLKLAGTTRYVRQRGRADAGGDRRAGDGRHLEGSAARPDLHEPHHPGLPAFAEFYGMEETIERIVGFFRHAAQGLEERKQILYLLGPVGGGKSSLAERLKALMECTIYVLKAGDQISPVFESPLGLFDPEKTGALLEDRYSIPRRRLTGL